MRCDHGLAQAVDCERLEERIAQLVRPVAAEVGVELLAVQLHGGRRSGRVRIVVDRAGGVTTDELERISRALSLLLDVEDPFDGPYRLEVTSPGLDWPLTTPADFSRYAGAWLAVVTRDGRRIEGRNLGLREGALHLAVVEAGGRGADEREVVVALEDAVRVVRAVERRPRRGRRRSGAVE